MKRIFLRLKQPLRNERGEITFFACFFVVGIVMLISFLLLYASIRITCINIRNGAKMELNNLSGTIYADTYRSQRETNFEEYLNTLYSSSDYTDMLEAKLIEGIEDFLFRYCDPEPLTEEGFPIYMLKTKVPNGSCIFLTDGRCSVYPARTRTCRIYPLTVGPGERGRDFEYCLCLDRHQSHFTGSRVSVKDWLYQNFKREDKEYVKREYEIATELGKLMRAIDPAMRPGIVFKVLYYRYYNFDLDQPFQPQYEQNNRHLLADLHRIAGEQ